MSSACAQPSTSSRCRTGRRATRAHRPSTPTCARHTGRTHPHVRAHMRTPTSATSLFSTSSNARVRRAAGDARSPRRRPQHGRAVSRQASEEVSPACVWRWLQVASRLGCRCEVAAGWVGVDRGAWGVAILTRARPEPGAGRSGDENPQHDCRFPRTSSAVRWAMERKNKEGLLEGLCLVKI